VFRLKYSPISASLSAEAPLLKWPWFAPELYEA
jgi:hypothetical protein